MSHLNSFLAAIPGKGANRAVDLWLTVVFSNHVYTERAQHGEAHHVLDHNNAKRKFNVQRYQMSLTLGERLKAKIAANELTFMSRSFGGIDNLILIEMSDGSTWTIVYCLLPEDDGMIRMEVLSAHPKIIDQRKISRKPLSYFTRQCIFEKRRVP
ncbi:hypothetical protein [Rhizobium sp. G21]|uniref:hypothetical protein n=1 Tax=Rhizobium sp. G21 TaxID=2758439 RepID=UPI001601D592|nr:hypothetical protein [Rhizobium sp. G21]MBB1248484.1 hypothetical protein [Rhizobium sp. G21]